MKAFLLNDFYLLKKNLLAGLGLFALFAGYQLISIFTGNVNIFIVFGVLLIFSFFAFRIILSSLILDEESKLIYYIRALPVGVKAYVDAKFLLNLILTGFCYLVSLLSYFLLMKNMEAFNFILLVFSLFFLSNMIIQSMVMKFGYNNVYLYAMLLFVIVYFAGYFAYKYIPDQIEGFINSLGSGLGILFVGIDIVAYFVLRKISYKSLMQRGE